MLKRAVNRKVLHTLGLGIRNGAITSAGDGAQAAGKNGLSATERARVSLFAHEFGWPTEHQLRRSGARALRSFAPAISMMKTAEPGTGDQRGGRRRLAFHWSSVRCVPIEGIVNPVDVMVVHVIANEPPQMFFVQRDDMVENLAAAASHPALRNPVLPRCLNTRALRSEACCLQETNHIRIELGVVSRMA